ncbi:MAG: hypothetical protein AB1782_20885 [Cyanobacteriota bacterium]
MEIILVPFMIVALIAFVVFIMCVILMIDIKLKAIVTELKKVTAYIASKTSSEENK